MYRLIVESLLGLRLETDKLFIEPRLPSDWITLKIHYRYRETMYHITLTQLPEDKNNLLIMLDGVECPDKFIRMVDDHIEHQAEVKLNYSLKI
jgi:cellobiose phosphorylase